MDNYPDSLYSDMSSLFSESSNMDSMSSLPCAAFLLQEYLADTTAAPYVNEQEQILPRDYKPTTYDVICGRGKGYYDKPGNKRFRLIVAQYVDSYKPSHSRIHKSLILQQIIDRVCAQDNGQAQFLRYDCKIKCWCRLSMDHAREKVGHAMRECSQANVQAKQRERIKMILLRKMKETSAANKIMFSGP
jgi:hypothetical protein